jgi:SAM-dependent methyltransferase
VSTDLDGHGVAPFHRVSRALGAGAAIATAHACGAFDALAGGATAAAVAAAAGLDPRAAGLLLDALVDAGAVARGSGDTYEPLLPADAVALLVEHWSALGDFATTGVASGRLDDRTASAAVYAPIAGTLGDVEPAARERVAHAIGDPGRRLLDLGAGVAPWSLTLASRHPDLALTLVELPGVAVATEASVAAAGVADRAVVVAGDALEVPLDGGFDTVLVANVCRLFDEHGVRTLLGRAAAATAPGGRIVIIDALPDADRSGDASVGVYALGLALRTSRGRVHPFSAYAAWLYDVGFVRIEAEPLGVPELSMIRATRPG